MTCNVGDAVVLRWGGRVCRLCTGLPFVAVLDDVLDDTLSCGLIEGFRLLWGLRLAGLLCWCGRWLCTSQMTVETLGALSDLLAKVSNELAVLIELISE